MRLFRYLMENIVTITFLAVLSACGGGGGGSSGGGTGTAPVQASCAPAGKFCIGGTVTGLATGNSITLQNNGSDNLTLTADGSFKFATNLANQARYNASILTSPTGQPCSSSYASGMVSTADVTDIAIFCGPAAAGLFVTAFPYYFTTSNHTATLLNNGKVLVAGGLSGSAPLSYSMLYDPGTGFWTQVGSMADARHSHTATLLKNGKVLVTGGIGGATGIAWLKSAEIFDPSTNSWSLAASTKDWHVYHTATLLRNGKVLLAAGEGNGNAATNAEIYDPTANTWTYVASTSSMRVWATATLLQDGRVLIAGGTTGSAVNTTEIYDVSNNTWTPAASMATARDGHGATLLPNGKVLVSGGFEPAPATGAESELYDPASNSWSSAGTMFYAHVYHTATLLPTGKVLVAGGYLGYSIGTNATAELYDPSTNSWTTTGGMTSWRVNHTATLLNTGKLLIVGGFILQAAGTRTDLASAELYW